MAERWPDYLIERARRSPPSDCGVVVGSTPVVSFGDPVRPRVATLGINPSRGEFLSGDGQLLDGTQRRLATLESLRATDYRKLDGDRAARIVSDCATYFERRPYLRWFRPLDRILRAGADVSYFDASACHLDLVQWATAPVWGGLDEATRLRLLEEDQAFLRQQLRQEHYRLVLVNGRTVMRWVERAGLARWRHVRRLEGSPPADLFLSDDDEPLFVAWSSNLQSQPGAARHGPALAAFVAEQADVLSEHTSAAVTTPELVPKDTHLSSVADLAALLERWLDHSTTTRLGATDTYAGAPWLTFDTPLGKVDLNADTHRDAINSFVGAAQRPGGLVMQVSANRRGRVNKVTFERCQRRGWYAYLRRPLAAPDSVAVMATEASVVQFPHPGGEHVPRGDVMSWNTGPHRRKFLRSHGSIVDRHGAVTFSGPVVFWGEWEPPSTISRRWPRAPGLPTVLHDPCWSDPGDIGARQNTDPWVFGPHFLYSNCKQLNPSGTPAALQRLPIGSLILFGSVTRGEFALDTVFVVRETVGRYRPCHGIASESKSFDVCTIDSLATGTTREREATFTLFRGATPQQPIHGMFSFVPCRPSQGDNSRFARPPIKLPGIINPRSRQSPSGAKVQRPHEEVIATWRAVVEQVTAAGLELGVGFSEPPRCP